MSSAVERAASGADRLFTGVTTSKYSPFTGAVHWPLMKFRSGPWVDLGASGTGGSVKHVFVSCVLVWIERVSALLLLKGRWLFRRPRGIIA